MKKSVLSITSFWATTSVLAVTLVALSGCNVDILKDNGRRAVVTPVLDKPATLDFASVNARVLQVHCAKCHGAGSRRGDFSTAAAIARFIVPGQPDASELFKRLKANGGDMPDNADDLPAEEVQILRAWILAGAPAEGTPGTNGPAGPETPPQPLPTPEPTPSPQPLPTPASGVIPNPGAPAIDFAMVRAQVIEPKCLKCHAADVHKGDVILDTYKDVIDNLYEVRRDILDGSMPKKDVLTPEQKQTILSWIDAGAPEKVAAPVPNPNPGPNSGSGALPAPASGVIPAPASGGLPAPIVLAPPIPDGGTVDERAVLAQGRYLFQVGSCATCHTAAKGLLLAGGRPLVSPFGTFYAPNITPSKRFGIGRWTEQDFIRALRKGVGLNHKLYYPAFPFTSYSRLTEADISAIYKYMQTLPAVDQPNRKHKIGFPYNQRSLMNVWRELYFQKVEEPTLRRLRVGQGPFLALPSKDAVWNRGAYLTEGPLHCAVCHTPRDTFGGLVLGEWMSGSTASGEKHAAPNITPDPATGLKRWTDADWLTFLNTGKTPDGDSVGGEMKNIIYRATAILSDDDKKAVMRYMQSLKPVENEDIADIIKHQAD